MIFVWYLIFCFNLFYSFNQAKLIKFSLSQTRKDQKKLLKTITVENQDEYLSRVMNPYWNQPYNEQLERKQNRSRYIVDKIEESIHSLKPCKLLQIVPSPVTKAYRNKDEFQVGRGVDGNAKTVGIATGKYSLGRKFAFSANKLVTIKESHKKVAQVFQDFIRTSPLPPCYKVGDGGHWRSIHVRSTEAGDIMAVVIVQPFGYSNKTIQKHQIALKDYFIKHLPNISLFHQQCKYRRCTRADAPFNLLYGTEYVIEILNGCKFKISPDTHIPTNKLATEVLYDTITKADVLKPNTTLIDVCSGSGTSSIVLSKFVKEAIGIDYMAQGNIDAKYNAEINNVHNVKFLKDSIDTKLKSVLEELPASSEIVVMVNSADSRPGLAVIKTIRASPKISRLVYTCGRANNPGPIINFVGLCSNSSSNFTPFRLTKVIPLDLLPQTVHVDLILLFER